MPIYAYRCATCGHAQDVLQKMSDDVLTVCPSCRASTYAKQVTAAGFQLKGSGWYVTDFRGGNSGAPAKADGDAAKDGAGAADKPADKGAEKPADKASEKSSDKAAGAAPVAAPSPAPAPAPAAASASAPAAAQKSSPRTGT
jgi:putative FmdB family regulatory protein